MQHLLIAVPEPAPTIIEEENASLTVKKLEAGTNRPLSGVTFKIESVNDPGSFSVTRATGADGTLTLTQQADNLQAGQYTITEVAAPAGYKAQTASQVVTVMPNTTTSNVFTFYNEPEKTVSGEGSIRKVDADNPSKGISGAVIRITSVKLDDGSSFVGEYTTGDGGYISKDHLGTWTRSRTATASAWASGSCRVSGTRPASGRCWPMAASELSELQADFPAVWQEYIERLSEYMASTGRTYKSHAATIRRWIADDRRKAAPVTRDRDYSVKEGDTV